MMPGFVVDCELEGDWRIVTFAIFSAGQDECRVVWIADLMPNEVAGALGGMIQQALNTMKQTLENTMVGRA